MTITYDEFRDYLADQASRNRVFGIGQHGDAWLCNCPVASFMVECHGLPSGRLGYTGSQLVVLKEDETAWEALPDEQQPDELFFEFARRVDEVTEGYMVMASTALAIWERVT